MWHLENNSLMISEGDVSGTFWNENMQKNYTSK